MHFRSNPFLQGRRRDSGDRGLNEFSDFLGACGNLGLGQSACVGGNDSVAASVADARLLTAWECGAPHPDIGQDGVVEYGPEQFSALELSFRQISPLEVCREEVRGLEMGRCEVRAFQVGARQLCSLHMGVQICTAKVRSCKITALEE